jgi:hypothetical protein
LVREKEKYGHDVLVKNSLVKRRCETVRCHDSTASSFVAKVRGEVFAHFHTVAVVCGSDFLAYQGEFFVKNLLDVK